MIVKGVEELSSEFSDYGSVDGFMAVLIALLFFGTVYALEAVGNGIWFRPRVREILADYAYPVSGERGDMEHSLTSADRNHLLDWVFSHSRHTETRRYSDITTYQSLLPYRISSLGYRLLEPSSQMGLRSNAYGFSSHASFLF